MKTVTSLSGEPTTGDDDEWIQICQRLKMHPLAAPGWRMICVQPMLAMLTFFGSSFLSLLTFPILFFGGLPWSAWHAVIPQTTLLVGQIVFSSGLYCFGPAFAGNPIGRAMHGALVVLICSLSVTCFVGPDSFVPFNNKAVTSILLLFGIFSVCLSGEAGGTAARHPAEPHSNMRIPIVRAAILAVRGINAISDFAVARVMFRQVCRWSDPLHVPSVLILATHLADIGVASAFLAS